MDRSPGACQDEVVPLPALDLSRFEKGQSGAFLDEGKVAISIRGIMETDMISLVERSSDMPSGEKPLRNIDRGGRRSTPEPERHRVVVGVEARQASGDA